MYRAVPRNPAKPLECITFNPYVKVALAAILIPRVAPMRLAVIHNLQHPRRKGPLQRLFNFLCPRHHFYPDISFPQPPKH